MMRSFSTFVGTLPRRFVFAAGALLVTAGLALGISSVARAQQTDVSGQQHILERAQAEQKNGDLAAAARDYEAALQVDPGFAEVRVNLGLVYQLQDRLPEAMDEFAKALKIRPTLAGANFFLGVDYCKVGRSAKGIPYLEAAAKEQPEKKDIWMWLATAQELSGQIDAQAATLQHGLTIFPNDADFLYELGTAYEKLGENTVDQLSVSNPASFRSEELLGESYTSSSEWPVAVLH
ncbi:MAG: tetratricopeptide repeat protein, partial [Candidatus Acidiferrales bacterium]